MPAIAAPQTPTGLLYGRSMSGSFRRSKMKDSICMKYEITAPKTAIVNSAAPTFVPDDSLIHHARP